MIANLPFSAPPEHYFPIEKIRTDGGTQSRAELNWEVVLDYAEAMKSGKVFPPILVFLDEKDLWLVDGFHRLYAAQKAGLTRIGAEIGKGTRRDAVLYSVGVNAAHGLRRSNADKRCAVEKLLRDQEWQQWSDSAIAKACGVSHPFVGKVRAEISPTCNGYKSDGCEGSEIATYNGYKSAERKGLDGRITNTAKVGKKSRESHLDNQARELGVSTSRDQVLPSMKRNDSSAFDVDNIFGGAADGAIAASLESHSTSESAHEETPTKNRKPHEPFISSATDEHYTPKEIVAAVLECFQGRIELDPCSNSHASPNVPAINHFTKEDDGLNQEWRVQTAYMNPPYSQVNLWVQKAAEEYSNGRASEIILLVKADTSTRWFKLIWKYSPVVCFVDHRLCFLNESNKGNSAPFPSAVAYFGPDVERFYHAFEGKVGVVVERFGKKTLQ